MKQIAILIFYFGRLPWYFEYFIHSCAYNPSIDFYLFTDSELSDIKAASNIYFIKQTLDEFKNMASEKFGFRIGIDHPYKFCDFRPALAYLFPEYIAGYDFWGYGDLDVIYGNIRNFISDELLHDYDIISVRHDFLPGAFSLFRNDERINQLFKESKDYKKVFEDPRHYCFDETNFTYEEFAEDIPVENIKSEIESMTHLVKKLHNQNSIKAYFDFHVIEGLPGKMKWHKGTLIYRNQYEAVLYHLIKLKRLYKPKNMRKSIPDTFYISPTRIYTRSIKKND